MPANGPRAECRSLAQTFLVFLPLPILGTLLHEAGHFGVAWVLGRQPMLHYMSTDWRSDPSRPLGPGEDLAIALGGPCVDIIIGTVGVVWLARLRRNHRGLDAISTRAWVAALLAAFWSRPVFVAL